MIHRPSKPVLIHTYTSNFGRVTKLNASLHKVLRKEAAALRQRQVDKHEAHTQCGFIQVYRCIWD